MKNFLLFNQSFGTEGSPNQTGETLTRENRIGLMSYLRRTLMLLFAVLTLACGNVWGDTYTWSFASGSGTLNNNKTDFTSTSGSKTLSYKGGSSNDGWDGTPKYLKMGGKSSFSSGTYSDRYFTFKAPSASGKISIAFAGTANNADITTSLTGYPLVRATIVGAASSTVTSDIITGLTAGTTDIYIIFPGDKAYIYSITWTDATLSANNELYSSDYKSTMESGGTYSGSSGSIITSSLPSDKGSYTSAFKTTSSSGYATVSFASALSLNSDGNDRGYIEIEYSHSGAYGFALSINGGSSVASYVLKKGGQGIHTARYTIPTGVTSISSITATGSGSTSLYLFHVKVVTHAAASWKLRGSWNSWEGEGATMTESAGVASITMELSANSRYEFKFKDPSGNQYGNTGAIVHSISGWEYRTDKDNGILYTGPAGDYTFSINTSSHVASVTYPDVDHPNSNYVYIKKGGSWSDARIYNWDSSSDSKMSDWDGSPVLATTTICGTEYWYGAAYFDKLKFRDAGSNQSNNMDLVRGKWLDETTHADVWSNFTTYTISFAGNGNTGGSMADITGICPGADQELPANTFEKTGYTFAEWKDGSSNDYADEATINDISSNITLTAQWTAKQCTVTFDKESGSGGSNNATATYDAAMPDITPPTRAGYDFAGYWDGDNGTGTQYYKATGKSERNWDKNTTSNTTLYAKWTIKTYTVTFASNNGSYGSVSPTSIASVSHGSTVSIASNVLTLKGTNVTATPTAAGADYTYAFSSWSVSNGAAITEAQTITANFTRTANTYDVDVTLTDSKATKKSGTTGSNAATFGTNHTLEFEAVSGYELPNDVTVIIGSDEVTKDEAYTWSVSEGVGTLQIGGSYILGNIAITVTATSTCSTPANPDGLAAGSISSSGATYTITDDESPASYEIYYSTSSTDPTGSTVASTTTTSKSKSVTGLTANTTYYAWVRAVCNDDYKSDWVALTGSTFKTLAEGTKYYLFTPTKNAEPAHTGTLSGQFRCATSTPANNSQTIDGHSMSHWCKFSTQTSLSGGTYYHGKTFIAYDIKTNSTDFTLYFYNNASAAKDIYYALIQEGITSAPTPVKVGTATANSTGKATFTITASKNTRILFYTEDQTNMRCHQIVAEESGSALPKPGESGYKVGFKGTYSRFTDYSEGTNKQGILDDSVKVVCYSNYSMGTADALKIHTSGTDYISFRTGASACQVKVCVSSSKTYYLGTSKSATTNSQTSTHTFALAANTRYYINPSGNDVTVDSIVFLPAPSGFTVSIAANPAGYGTVSSSSVTSVASGTTLSASTNTLSVGATDVTASVTSATAEYTYAFSNWTKSDGTALPSNVTSDLSVYANFTRSANSYTLTWDANGGSDGACTGSCTSGSTAYNTTLVAPTDPTLSNYTFDGWNTANDGSGSAAAATMPAANTTYYAAWKQTVTLTTGAQGSGGNQTPYVYLNGTGVSSFTPHTASGYSLQGYYTAGSGGVKVLNEDGTFASANVDGYITSSKWSRTGAAPTLYAQWVAAEDCHTLKYAWKVTGNFCDDKSTSVTASDTVRFPANASNLYFTESGTGNTVVKGSSYNIGKTQNNYFLLTAKSGYQFKSICFYGKIEDSSVNYTTDGSSWSSLESTGTSSDDYYSFNNINASAFGIKLTASSPSGVWIRNMVIEVCASDDVTYNVTYDDNGKTGGAVPSDATNYSYGTTVTVKGNTGSLAKTNYTFAGWTTNNNGTGSNYVADNTFSITANTTLYAKWTQSVTLNKNGGSTDGSATAVWNATGLTGITHAKPAAGYKLLGYYSASSEGTKVLNSDGSFAATNVTDYITDGKWSRTSATTLYAEYESAGALTWNLIVNSDTTNLSTSTKTSAFTEISTTNMTDAALTGLTYSKGKKSSLTGKISTPAYDAGKYAYVTFKVADGYKFTPSNIAVKVQPVGNGEHKAVKFTLTDGSNTLASASSTKCDGTSDGKTTTVSLAGDGTYFVGTVTLKIYVYPDATASATTYECYRLGTPITIEGEVEETCATMPSYTSMSYTTTTFAPNADASGSPITIVGGDNIDTYHWKYNTTNDRTSGTECGSNDASLTPLTNAGAATDVTRYYWCEMENTSCGITIKSPAVAITVAAAKSDATVEWTNPASTPNYGGGGYTIKATVNETGWNGNAADLVITAPAGINIYNVTSGTTSSQKWVQADFDVQTSFDRSTYASNIPFTVSAAATATYNAISDEKDVDYSACTGGSASEELMPVNADSVNSTVKGWRFAGTGKMWFGHGSSAPSTGSSNIKSLDNTMAEGNIDHYYNSGGSYFSFYTEKAITGVRLYVYTSNSNVKVSNVYIANSQFATGTPSSGAVTYEVVYNDDNEGLDKGDNVYSAWAEITFDSEVAAGKYGLIKLDDNVKIAGIGLISTSGGGATLNTYLQWSGSLADKATVAKYTTDAYFTYSASKITENTNTLGAITYSSSNTSAATVDATGKVALVAAGSTTIKATLAASGCYKKAEISYTLNVTEVPCAITAGTLTLTSGSETKCEDDEVTLTLTGFESGASIQWKDGDTDIDNGGNYTIATDVTTRTSTLTTNQEGTYSVMVTSDCSVRSNRITISNKSAEVGAKRIVKNWYIKNGRLTPDIELWTLQNGAHLSSVAWDPANATGLTASDFYESDGKVYLKGKEPSSNTSGEDITYTLTLTVEDDCGSTTAMSASGQLIYLHHQQNTDKHVLAFVVSGTDKGGFTEGTTAEQTTSVPLYNEIAENFDVLATNIRSTDDEQALKEYYSQFDILCVTDYPNTGDKGANKKSYVDALGALVDIRPILTMEAWVSKLANWKAKGISGTPKSPTTRQYTMLLQCKDHEIFAGTKLTKVGEGDETMYRISMVCDTLEDYKTLDATYGDGAHADKSGYEYASKPALQGFTFDATMADDGLLPLGLIDDGSGNDLQVGIERQTEMEARLMVLGINSYAMERLTDDGQTVVVNALKYLMKKNSEDIADCSNTFVGGDDEEDESTRYDWNVDSHWSGNAIPDRTQKVRIVAPCVIKADEKFHVTGVVIAPIGKYNHGANTANGSLTIAAGGALIVDGKVEEATAPLYTETRATAPADLTIGSDADGNGTLIFDNEDGSTQAIVEYYSRATTDEAENWNWQYIAVPFNDNSSAYRNYYDSYLYRWAEDCSGWEIVPNRGEVYPWVGYTITQEGAKTYVMDGTLVETGEMEFTVPAGKNLVLGNSWTAPIQVKQFTDDDFANMSKNVYLFNTGYAPNGGGSFSGTRYEGGTYVTIPIHSSTYTGDSLISSLQAFIVYAKTDEGGGTFTLDYDRHVRPARSTDKVNAGPMHAPKRGGAIDDKPAVLKVWASGSRYDDRLVVLEREDFSTGLDEGWDGNKRVAGNSSPLIFAVTDNGREAVSAIPTMEGTLIGFWAGEDNEYTLHFEYNEEDELYLLDLDNNTYTPVNSNSTYVFTVPDKKAHNRFILTRNAPDPVATGVEEMQASEKPEAKAIKFLKDEKVFIFVNGKLYDATGKIVR